MIKLIVVYAVTSFVMGLFLISLKLLGLDDYTTIEAAILYIVIQNNFMLFCKDSLDELKGNWWKN